MIFSYLEDGGGIDKRLAPNSNGGWGGGYNPTQEIVDAYAMAETGRFPITGYTNEDRTTPVIDPEAGYKEAGYSQFTNPCEGKERKTYNMFVGREPRFYASIIYNGATWKEKTIYTYVDAENGFAAYRDNMNPGEKQTVTGYFIRKYLQENNTEFDDKGSDQFWIEMRYAEVLLNLAEALAEQDYAKNQDDALEALNEVRRRVDLPDRTTQEAPDKDSFMKLLRKERICELAFEGFRYWDLRRWRLAGEVIDGKQAHGTKITKKDDNSYTYEQVSCDDNINRFFPERYYLLPIPVDELQNNPLM